MPRTMTGGCQCGRIRYEAAVADDEAYLCHCDMCKRATGGVSVAFRNVRFADVTWTAAEPDWYRSSPIAKRAFCATCGTPIGFRYVEGSENMDLTVGSFDEPGFFRPTSQFAIENRLDAWSDTAHLTAIRLDEYQPLIDRWKKAVGSVPD